MGERWSEADLAAIEKRQGAGIETVIGIDPGKNTGFAVFDKRLGKMAVVKALDFWQVFNSVLTYEQSKTKVVIEVPRTKAQFGGKGSHTRSVNIGFVIREAQLMAEGLKAKGYEVKEVQPRGKVDADKFKRLTGYVGRTNEHSRDAGMLAFRG